MQEIKSIIGKHCATFEEIKKQSQLIAEKFNPEKIILFGLTIIYYDPQVEGGNQVDSSDYKK